MSAPTSAPPVPPTPEGPRLDRRRRPDRPRRTPLVAHNLRLSVAAAVAVGLGTFGLAPVFDGLSWLPQALLAVLVVAVIGTLARAIRLPLPLHPLAQGAGLAILMTLMFVRDTALAGFVPGPDSLAALRDLLRDGATDIDRLTPPVEPTTGIVAIVVLGVGLAALLVDALAVPLRQPTLAGVPLLGMYAVPAVVLPEATPWWAFIPGALGWLVLLLTDTRLGVLAHGRVLSTVRRTALTSTGPRPDGYADTTRLRGLGLGAVTLGVCAVAVALLVPVAVPGLDEPVLTARGSGGSGVVSVNPLVSLKRDFLQQDDREIIRYTTTDETPEYLRLAVSTDFDGQTWRPAADSQIVDDSRELDRLTPPTDIADQAGVTISTYDVNILQLGGEFLPVPYPVEQVNVRGNWFFDPATRMVYSPDEDTVGLNYSLTRYDVPLTAAGLRAAPPAGQLGDNLPADARAALQVDVEGLDDIAAIAQDAVRGQGNDFDRAVALQNWFRNNFTYSLLTPPGNSTDDLRSFLVDREGYCEQFAATMALMARQLGIPARVAVGFTSGQQTSGDSWSVSLTDAHAWPELWFEGAGWVRFEPTPRGGAESGVSVPGYTQDTPDGNNDPSSNPTDEPTDEPTAGPTNPTDGPSAAPTDAASEAAAAAAALRLDDPDDGRRTFLAVSLLVLLAAALLALSVPAMIRTTRRRRRLREVSGARTAEGRGVAAEAAWAELRDTVIDYGGTWSRAETPRQSAARIVAVSGLQGPAADAVRQIARVTESARYAPTAPEPGNLGEGLSLVRRALRERAATGQRLRAVILPRSLRRA